MRPSKNLALMEALGAAIKARRLDLKMSQEDLAGLCEIDRPYISLIEVARKQPTLSVLWRIAIGLDWRLSELMRHVEDRYALEERVRKRAAKTVSAAFNTGGREPGVKRRS
jgi:transcriptional regulator with XRE-family HTH domain